MNNICKMLAILGFGAMVANAPALADDRAPTMDERAQIEQQLQSLGFVSWEEIELDDDGYWEIDDARHSDGREYDLKLEVGSLDVLEIERD